MTALIRAEQVSYSYPQRGMVLDQADLSLFVDEKVSLEGSNGAGKTTLLNLLVGLNKPKAGRIIAFGRERFVEADFIEVRSKAGFLFQDPDDQLFCPTVLEDVAFGPMNQGKTPEEAKAVSLEVLDCLGLAGFDERVTHQLSGGEKRLVTLASVLAMKPEVLLLDEPSNALDKEARIRLIEVLQSLSQAMIIISHEPGFLDALVTRRTRLEGGKVLDV